MANSSFAVILSTPLSQTEMTGRYVGKSSLPHEQMRKLTHLFRRLDEGLTQGIVSAYTSANAPVRATNTVTLTYASISNSDTVVIGTVTLTVVTGTPSGQAQFKKLTDATTTAANLVACVNAHTTLSKLMVASNLAGVVTLTMLAPGLIGNQVPLTGSTGMVAGASYFANGAGGIETVPVSYSRA